MAKMNMYTRNVQAVCLDDCLMSHFEHLTPLVGSERALTLVTGLVDTMIQVLEDMPSPKLSPCRPPMQSFDMN